MRGRRRPIQNWQDTLATRICVNRLLSLLLLLLLKWLHRAFNRLHRTFVLARLFVRLVY